MATLTDLRMDQRIRGGRLQICLVKILGKAFRMEEIAAIKAAFSNQRHFAVVTPCDQRSVIIKTTQYRQKQAMSVIRGLHGGVAPSLIRISDDSRWTSCQEARQEAERRRRSQEDEAESRRDRRRRWNFEF